MTGMMVLREGPKKKGKFLSERRGGGKVIAAKDLDDGAAVIADCMYLYILW